ncbi:MAG: hypothetical protein HY551_02060 [Elusimicrobia bacterium]|nr:hypothetical protein [Elusimicrobiota bacterium]
MAVVLCAGYYSPTRACDPHRTRRVIYGGLASGAFQLPSSFTMPALPALSSMQGNLLGGKAPASLVFMQVARGSTRDKAFKYAKQQGWLGRGYALTKRNSGWTTELVVKVLDDYRKTYVQRHANCPGPNNDCRDDGVFQVDATLVLDNADVQNTPQLSEELAALKKLDVTVVFLVYPQ